MDQRRQDRPRTRMTGVWPRGPQVLARGGVIEDPASSSKTIQASSAAARFPPVAALPRERGHLHLLPQSDCLLVAFPGASGGACQDQPWRCRSRHAAATEQVRWKRRPITVRALDRVHRWSAQPWAAGPLVSCSSRRANWVSVSLGRPGDPREAGPCSPASCHLRRQRSTDRSVTRSSCAMRAFFSPRAKRPAVSSRICSRACRRGRARTGRTGARRERGRGRGGHAETGVGLAAGPVEVSRDLLGDCHRDLSALRAGSPSPGAHPPHPAAAPQGRARQR